jgi:hypothetical protein
MVKSCVFFAVRTEFLNIIPRSFDFKGLRVNDSFWLLFHAFVQLQRGDKAWRLTVFRFYDILNAWKSDIIEPLNSCETNWFRWIKIQRLYNIHISWESLKLPMLIWVVRPSGLAGDITTQKKNINILTTVRTWNLANLKLVSSRITLWHIPCYIYTWTKMICRTAPRRLCRYINVNPETVTLII